MTLPTMNEWKDATKGNIFQTRSTALKTVDAALATYLADRSDANKKALRAALKAWMDAKGPGEEWKNTLRNQKGAVQTLWDEVQPYRAAASAWTAPALPTNPKAGQFYLAQSFEFATSLARTEVPRALERARQLVNVAYVKVQQANRPGPDRDNYVRFFGAFDGARWATVRRNLKDVYDALWLRPIILYYRGEGVSGTNDCPAESGDLVPGSFFGAAWKPANLPAALDANYTYIFLGKAFFTANVYQSDATGGVIIHELTHAICGTDDVTHDGVKTYGVTRCQKLAVDRPDLAIKNADSYEYLCEFYQNRLYQPTPLNLNLPAKASISLSMRAPSS